ncbi:hypothetical protein [Chitinophaga sp. OAE865]|uniref:hypothetical protein n=1 Tax=Chitinophaga sp. OAE865 TaxID=2817898 RepID=UPI001AE3EB2B
MEQTEASKFTATWVESPIYKNGMSDNLIQYRKGLSNKLTDKQAAWQTWSGRQAEKHGFTNVTVNKIENGVQAVFTK